MENYSDVFSSSATSEGGMHTRPVCKSPKLCMSCVHSEFRALYDTVTSGYVYDHFKVAIAFSEQNGLQKKMRYKEV